MVMHVELQATCSALGYHEGSQYIKEPDCLETVKELIRFLRREDDTCDIRRQLGHAQILQKDLLPLVKQHHKDKPLFDTVIRLLVNLTQPVLVCFNNQLPDEKTLRQYCLEIESHLQQYKEAFVDEELFTVLTKKMTELLELDWEHRHEEDKLMLERLLVFVRNILHIPPDPATEQRTDDDASLHDQILWAIHVSGMEDLLLYVASSENERHLCMHILEIASLMFREQSPEVLALAGVQRSMTEKEKDERELEVARAKERAQKRSTMLRFNTRHSNFGGTYVMMNTKSLSDRELIYHKSVQDADNFTLDTNKRRRKKPKNRQPIKDTPVIRRSTLSIRLGLKEFCVQFLENAYNPLMYAVKDNLVRETTQELDETYYFWSMQFFMEFCRHHSSHVDFISETLSVPTFHYIYNNLLRYYEMIMVEKKEAIVWGRRVHLALRAYQELLMTLDMMDKSNNSHLRDSARVIKSNVFYVMEFRDIFITLLNKFDESKNSRAYLKDLVETTHLFLRMLEKFTKTNNHLIVQAKKRKRRKKAKKAAKRSKEPSEQQLEDMWQEVSSELSALLQGREEVPQDIAPFDAASEVDVDQQRVDAMVRIHTALRQKQAGEAVAIFRAAREVWPERNEFGSQDITAEEEFMALREIFMAPLPGGDAQPEEAPVEEEEENEEEEEAAAVRTDWEQEFNFTEYLMGYAKPQILKAYVLLAADFEKNLAHTNHCVAKMLHRIGFDLGFIGMLFQASLFRVFQKLMHGALARSARFQELYKLGVHVVRRFSEVAEKNKKIFMEMLFWKGSREAMQITEGYDYNPSTTKVPWTENDENELMRLFEDFKDVENPEKDTVDLIMEQWSGANKTRGQIIRHLKHLHLINSIKDIKKKAHTTKVPWTENDENELMRLFENFKDAENPEKDTVDLIMEQWSGANKTRGQIIRHLKHLHLINSVKDIKRKKQSTREWTADDEQELESVFRENKNADDPLSSIMAALSKKRPKNKVVAKLLALGLICDPKEVHKKRRGKGQGERRGRRADSDNSGDEGEERGPGKDEDSDDEGPHEGSLPSDEEMLSSPSISGASSGDSDSSDDEGDEDEDVAVEQMEEQGLSASSSLASSGLVEMMINIVEKGYKDQVCWIHRLLTQNANTREGQDKIFSVPIVPLTEENETAMEDPVFMDFLHGLGLSPPANEQEMFWRIPAELTASALRVIAKGIELDDNGQPLNPETLSEIQRSKLRLVSSKDKKKKDRKKEKKKHRDSRAAGQDDKKRRKVDKEKVRRSRKKKVEVSDGNNSGDNDQAGVSDNDDVDEIDNKSDDEDDAGQRKSRKMLSAAQRREALQAMLERRKVKKVLNRKRRRSGDSTAKSDEGETTREEERTPAESAERIASTPDADTAPSKPGPRYKKRIKRVMDSDSDSDEDGDRLVIDQDRASSHASPTKPAKRIRLLDSDLSDDDNDLQNMDTSALSYKSDQDACASQSQSQSQGLLDFGDSDDDEDDKTEEKVKEGGDNNESSSDNDLPLTSAAKKKANVPESFPATLFSQGTPDSEDSELDDHVPLGALKKGRKIISDDSDDDK